MHAFDVLKKHIMDRLPKVQGVASVDAMSPEQHTAHTALEHIREELGRLAALGWPLVLMPVHDEHAEVADAVDKAVTDRQVVEFPKWVKLGGKEDGVDMLVADTRQEANVLAGRMPDEDAPAKDAPAKGKAADTAAKKKAE
jgi:hypothetical protein